MQTPPDITTDQQTTQTNPKPYKINTLGIQFELFSHPDEKKRLLSELKDILIQVSDGANWDDGKIQKKQRPGPLEPRKIACFSLQIPESQLSFKDFGARRKLITYIAKQASKVPNQNVKFIRPVVDYNHKLVGRSYSPYTRK